MLKSVTVLLTGLICCVAFVAAAPYQELAPRAGYVPVYIREGDTPLSEIHPGLAEAFGEAEEKTLTNAKREISEKAEQDSDSAVAAQSEVIKQNIDKEEESKLKDEKKAHDEVVEIPKEVEKPKDAVPDEAAESKINLDEKPAVKAESDIASFDVIKALDEAEKGQ